MRQFYQAIQTPRSKSSSGTGLLLSLSTRIPTTSQTDPMDKRRQSGGSKGSKASRIFYFSFLNTLGQRAWRIASRCIEQSRLYQSRCQIHYKWQVCSSSLDTLFINIQVLPAYSLVFPSILTLKLVWLLVMVLTSVSCISNLMSSIRLSIQNWVRLDI